MLTLQQALFIIVSASFHVGLTYAFLRYLERIIPEVPYVGFALILSFVFLFSTSDRMLLHDFFAHGLYLWFLGLAALAFLGGWFHRRSGGASQTIWAASFLILMVISVGTMIAIIKCLSDDDDSEIILYTGSVAFYAVASPLAVWAWKSLRLRPGIDVPLNSNHQEK